MFVKHKESLKLLVFQRLKDCSHSVEDKIDRFV